jgi:hypothetical protein
MESKDLFSKLSVFCYIAIYWLVSHFESFPLCDFITSCSSLENTGS